MSELMPELDGVFAVTRTIARQHFCVAEKSRDVCRQRWRNLREMIVRELFHEALIRFVREAVLAQR